MSAISKIKVFQQHHIIHFSHVLIYEKNIRAFTFLYKFDILKFTLRLSERVQYLHGLKIIDQGFIF